MKLNYAEIQNPRRVGQQITFWLVMAGVLFALWKWLPSAVRHVQVMRAQYECLTHPTPDGQLIYDTAGGNGLVPTRWRTLAPVRWSKGTVFLHEMRTQKGTRLLVAIDVDLGDLGEHARGRQLVLLRASVIEPGRLLDGPTMRFVGDAVIGLSVPLDARVQLYAGKQDPSDPAKFSIGYRVAGQSGSLAGQLHNDGMVTIRMDADATPPQVGSIRFR